MRSCSTPRILDPLQKNKERLLEFLIDGLSGGCNKFSNLRFKIEDNKMACRPKVGSSSMCCIFYCVGVYAERAEGWWKEHFVVIA